jgi:hypothetical protein
MHLCPKPVGKLVTMRNHDERNRLIAVDLCQQPGHAVSRSTVEISRRLVGQQ